VSALSAEIDRVSHEQIAYVNGLGASIAGRNDQIAGILKGIGRDVPSGPSRASDIGGAYIPLTTKLDPTAFSAGVKLVKSELDRYTAIRQLTTRLPLTAPVADPSISSDFGQRIDPFLGTPALHTGLDFRAEKGLPVGATAPGVVVAADTGYNGGYGNMVDVDHGNGIVTRFGHLSEIAVKVGQAVTKGTIIGRAGSSGRATGPHLHYEVRINDDPTDPTRFLTAGEKLLPLL
jgi:murein DD-endopeptidase MepM/ murein hydrolase activator NlpD